MSKFRKPGFLKVFERSGEKDNVSLLKDDDDPSGALDTTTEDVSASIRSTESHNSFQGQDFSKDFSKSPPRRSLNRMKSLSERNIKSPALSKDDPTLSPSRQKHGSPMRKLMKKGFSDRFLASPKDKTKHIGEITVAKIAKASGLSPKRDKKESKSDKKSPKRRFLKGGGGNRKRVIKKEAEPETSVLQIPTLEGAEATVQKVSAGNMQNSFAQFDLGGMLGVAVAPGPQLDLVEEMAELSSSSSDSSECESEDDFAEDESESHSELLQPCLGADPTVSKAEMSFSDLITPSRGMVAEDLNTMETLPEDDEIDDEVEEDQGGDKTKYQVGGDALPTIEPEKPLSRADVNDEAMASNIEGIEKSMNDRSNVILSVLPSPSKRSSRVDPLSQSEHGSSSSYPRKSRPRSGNDVSIEEEVRKALGLDGHEASKTEVSGDEEEDDVFPELAALGDRRISSHRKPRNGLAHIGRASSVRHFNKKDLALAPPMKTTLSDLLGGQKLKEALKGTEKTKASNEATVKEASQDSEDTQGIQEVVEKINPEKVRPDSKEQRRHDCDEEKLSTLVEEEENPEARNKELKEKVQSGKKPSKSRKSTSGTKKSKGSKRPSRQKSGSKADYGQVIWKRSPRNSPSKTPSKGRRSIAAESSDLPEIKSLAAKSPQSSPKTPDKNNPTSPRSAKSASRRKRSQSASGNKLKVLPEKNQEKMQDVTGLVTEMTCEVFHDRVLEKATADLLEGPDKDMKGVKLELDEVPFSSVFDDIAERSNGCELDASGLSTMGVVTSLGESANSPGVAETTEATTSNRLSEQKGLGDTFNSISLALQESQIRAAQSSLEIVRLERELQRLQSCLSEKNDLGF